MTRRLPDFLYIGINKAGSSWLFEVLREHPEVYVPIAKDVMFFDREFHRGIDWYASFFSRADGSKAVGELSNDYLQSSMCAERIHATIPDIRLLVGLREPGEWAVSRYLWARSIGLSPAVGFEEFIHRSEVIREVRYVENLRPFYRLFPRSNIRVLLFDELRANPVAMAQDVCSFLGVDPVLVPPSAGRTVLPARGPRLRGLSSLAYRTAQGLRGLGLPNVVGAVKRNRALQSLLFTTGRRIQVPQELLNGVREIVGPDNGALEELIGRKLPPSWT